LLASLLLLAILGAEPDIGVPAPPLVPSPAQAPTARPYVSSDSAVSDSVLSALTQAISRQGPLDGGWVIAEAGGGPLYHLQITDTPSGALEGAWRDLTTPPGAVTANGFLSDLRRDEAGLTVSFAVKDGVVTAAMKPQAGGGYAGELTAPGAPPGRPVVMTRP